MDAFWAPEMGSALRALRYLPWPILSLNSHQQPCEAGLPLSFDC